MHLKLFFLCKIFFFRVFFFLGGWDDLFDILFNSSLIFSSMILWNLPYERWLRFHQLMRKKFWKMLVISVDIEFWSLTKKKGDSFFLENPGLEKKLFFFKKPSTLFFLRVLLCFLCLIVFFVFYCVFFLFFLIL